MEPSAEMEIAVLMNPLMNYAHPVRRKSKLRCLYACPLSTNLHGPSIWTTALPTFHFVPGAGTVSKVEDANLGMGTKAD